MYLAFTEGDVLDIANRYILQHWYSSCRRFQVSMRRSFRAHQALTAHGPALARDLPFFNSGAKELSCPHSLECCPPFISVISQFCTSPLPRYSPRKHSIQPFPSQFKRKVFRLSISRCITRAMNRIVQMHGRYRISLCQV